jgi:hypothetical protein
MVQSIRRKIMESKMRWPILLAATVAAMSLASNAFADKYEDLVAKGFRWATADGPYAAVSKEDAHRVANHLSDSEIIKLVEEVKVYYLTPGTLVQVIDEDKKAGLSKIRMAGITSDLWTLSSFLTKRPIKDTYGVVETPETSGLIPMSEPIIDAGPTPSPPSFGTNPAPGALESPIPGVSPVPGALESPTPSENLMPEESPSPSESPQPSASPTPGTTP